MHQQIRPNNILGVRRSRPKVFGLVGDAEGGWKAGASLRGICNQDLMPCCSLINTSTFDHTTLLPLTSANLPSDIPA